MPATTIHSPDNLLGIWYTAWKASRKSETVNSWITYLMSTGSVVHPSDESYLAFLLGGVQHLCFQQIIFLKLKMMYVFQTFYLSNCSRNISFLRSWIYLIWRLFNFYEIKANLVIKKVRQCNQHSKSFKEKSVFKFYFVLCSEKYSKMLWLNWISLNK